MPASAVTRGGGLLTREFTSAPPVIRTPFAPRSSRSRKLSADGVDALAHTLPVEYTSPPSIRSGVSGHRREHWFYVPRRRRGSPIPRCRLPTSQNRRLRSLRRGHTGSKRHWRGGDRLRRSLNTG